MQLHLLIFVFTGLAFEAKFTKFPLRPRSISLVSILSFMNLNVSRLIFKFSIQFELIFVYGVRQQSSFVLLHVAFQLSQHYVLERFSFLHCMFLVPLLKISCQYMCGFISGLSILFHWSVCLVFCQYHTLLIAVDLQYSLKSGSVVLPVVQYRLF